MCSIKLMNCCASNCIEDPPWRSAAISIELNAPADLEAIHKSWRCFRYAICYAICSGPDTRKAIQYGQHHRESNDAATFLHTMTQIFVSHSSLDKHLADRFVDLLIVGLGLRVEQIYCSSLDGQGTPVGEAWVELIRRELSNASYVILLLTDAFMASPFCMCEMGATWALGKTAFPILFPPLGLSDLKGALLDRHTRRVTEEACLDELRDLLVTADPPPLAKWTAKKQQFIRGIAAGAKRSLGQQVLNRGDVFSHILDATLALVPPSEMGDVRDEIVRKIRTGKVIPTRYCYITEAGFRSWIELCEDREYRYFQDACTYYVTHSAEIGKVITDAVGATSLDYLSLGPGNGDKDLSLLRGILRQGVPSGQEVYYYPFDINPHMVAAAVTRVVGDRGIRKHLKVKAIISDFAELADFSPVYLYRSAPNVIALLGNTLGNMDNEREFLDSLYQRAMLPKDLLIIEVKRKAKARPESSMGNLNLNQRFDFGPLDVLGIPFEDSVIHYTNETGRSAVPDTLTSVGRCRLVDIDGVQYDDVLLSYVHHYNPAELAGVLKKIGFHILHESNEELFALVIAQKP